jgi:hypothetical protein
MNIRAFLNLPLLILLLMLAPACNNDSDAPPEATITIFGSAMLDDSLRLAGASVDLYVGDDVYPWQTVTTDQLGYFHFEVPQSIDATQIRAAVHDGQIYNRETGQVEKRLDSGETLLAYLNPQGGAGGYALHLNPQNDYLTRWLMARSQSQAELAQALGTGLNLDPVWIAGALQRGSLLFAPPELTVCLGSVYGSLLTNDQRDLGMDGGGLAALAAGINGCTPIPQSLGFDWEWKDLVSDGAKELVSTGLKEFAKWAEFSSALGGIFTKIGVSLLFAALFPAEDPNKVVLDALNEGFKRINEELYKISSQITVINAIVSQLGNVVIDGTTYNSVLTSLNTVPFAKITAATTTTKRLVDYQKDYLKSGDLEQGTAQSLKNWQTDVVNGFLADQNVRGITEPLAAIVNTLNAQYSSGPSKTPFIDIAGRVSLRTEFRQDSSTGEYLMTVDDNLPQTVNRIAKTATATYLALLNHLNLAYAVQQKYLMMNEQNRVVQAALQELKKTYLTPSEYRDFQKKYKDQGIYYGDAYNSAIRDSSRYYADAVMLLTQHYQRVIEGLQQMAQNYYYSSNVGPGVEAPFRSDATLANINKLMSDVLVAANHYRGTPLLLKDRNNPKTAYVPAAADFKAAQAYVTLDYRTPFRFRTNSRGRSMPGDWQASAYNDAKGATVEVLDCNGSPILYVKGTQITDSHYDSPATLGALLRDKSDVFHFLDGYASPDVGESGWQFQYRLSDAIKGNNSFDYRNVAADLKFLIPVDKFTAPSCGGRNKLTVRAPAHLATGEYRSFSFDMSDYVNGRDLKDDKTSLTRLNVDNYYEGSYIALGSHNLAAGIGSGFCDESDTCNYIRCDGKDSKAFPPHIEPGVRLAEHRISTDNGVTLPLVTMSPNSYANVFHDGNGISFFYAYKGMREYQSLLRENTRATNIVAYRVDSKDAAPRADDQLTFTNIQTLDARLTHWGGCGDFSRFDPSFKPLNKSYSVHLADVIAAKGPGDWIVDRPVDLQLVIDYAGTDYLHPLPGRDSRNWRAYGAFASEINKTFKRP